MTDEETVFNEPAVSAKIARLPARVFYGLVVASVLVGMIACAVGGGFYLVYGDTKPTGWRIWDGQADQFLFPVCIMIGATFGGLLGVAMAIVGDNHIRKRDGR